MSKMTKRYWSRIYHGILWCVLQEILDQSTSDYDLESDSVVESEDDTKHKFELLKVENDKLKSQMQEILQVCSC